MAKYVIFLNNGTYHNDVFNSMVLYKDLRLTLSSKINLSVSILTLESPSIQLHHATCIILDNFQQPIILNRVHSIQGRFLGAKEI